MVCVEGEGEAGRRCCGNVALQMLLQCCAGALAAAAFTGGICHNLALKKPQMLVLGALLLPLAGIAAARKGQSMGKASQGDELCLGKGRAGQLGDAL